MKFVIRLNSYKSGREGIGGVKFVQKWNLTTYHFQQLGTGEYPHKKISEILPLHSGIIVVLSNK